MTPLPTHPVVYHTMDRPVSVSVPQMHTCGSTQLVSASLLHVSVLVELTRDHTDDKWMGLMISVSLVMVHWVYMPVDAQVVSSVLHRL